MSFLILFCVSVSFCFVGIFLLPPVFGLTTFAEYGLMYSFCVFCGTNGWAVEFIFLCDFLAICFDAAGELVMYALDVLGDNPFDEAVVIFLVDVCVPAM